MNTPKSIEGGVVSLKEIDTEFLPVIYDIVKCVERDPSDAAGKNKESLEAANKIGELSKRLEKAKEQVRNLPGVDLNPEEQRGQLASLKKQLKLKKDLVAKYQGLAKNPNLLGLDASTNGTQ